MRQSLLDELDRFVASAWHPDLTVGDWWDRLGTEGWAVPTWPAEWYGRDVGVADAKLISQRIAQHSALAAPGGLGVLLAGPTIIAHGNDEQRRRFLRGIATGAAAWCQLFSEPGAGSDLAGVSTRAVLDGDQWVMNGQKVWSSGAHFADMAMLIARTSPEQPKHRGITWFALEMAQAGIDVRPLREMTGRSLFNEVFLTDARAGSDAVIGDVDDGWRVTNTTLLLERTGLGAGHGAASAARPGSRSGDLERRAGDLVRARRDGRGDPVGNLGAGVGAVRWLAEARGVMGDRRIRHGWVDLWMQDELIRLNAARMKVGQGAGRGLGGMSSIMKLQMSELVRRSRDLGMRVGGAYGTLHAYDAEHRRQLDAVTGLPS